MQYFYDGQLRRYLTQFIRLMSDWSWADNQGNTHVVPARYGNISKQVAGVLRQNSENFLQSAPFISCYVDSLDINRSRMQDPTYVSKISLRERDYGYTDQDVTSPTYGQYIEAYTSTQGPNYLIERIMPTPFDLTLKADIWTSNHEQKIQLLEQILVLFNPSLELQTTTNYIDWTSLSVLELKGINYTSQTIPQGDQAEIEIASLTFIAPIWLSPPSKVKANGIITQIISRVFDESGNYTTDLLAGVQMSKTVVTVDDYALLLQLNPNNTAQYIGYLIPQGASTDNLTTRKILTTNPISWSQIFEKYPSQYRASLSTIVVNKDNGTQLIGTIGVNPLDSTQLFITFNSNSLHSNSTIDGVTYVDAIIDPTHSLPNLLNSVTRYIITEDVDSNYFKNANGTIFTANANDIIKFDGSNWSVIFNSQQTPGPVYITNLYTMMQYKWTGSEWIKSVEGVYPVGEWQILL
jgi:hypothetical protein